MIDYLAEQRESDTPQDESAALQWAIENFRNNECRLKDADHVRKKLTYYKRLLSSTMKTTVIQYGGKQSIGRAQFYRNAASESTLMN